MLRISRRDFHWSAKRALTVMACLGLTAYFAHHAVSGHHGLEARRHLAARVPVLENQYAGLDAARERLKHDVSLLSSDFPSRDFVEEVAREMLGYVLPTELVWIGR